MNVPTVRFSDFANITAITSIPSMAPPFLTAIPDPAPHMSPPNTAHRRISVPAIGDPDSRFVSYSMISAVTE